MDEFDNGATPSGATDVGGNAPQDSTNHTDSPPTEPAERPVSARDAMIDQIARSRNEAFTRETGEELGADDPGDPGATDGADRDPPKDQLSHQLTDDERFIDGADMKAKVRLKVDGTEEVVSLEELVRSAQKFKAADRRLAEATQILSAAKTGAAPAPLENGETAATTPATTPALDLSAIEQTIRDEVKDALADLYRGDEDKAAEKMARVQVKAMQQLAAQAQPHASSTDAVIEQLEQRSALKSFFGAYPELRNEDEPVRARRMRSAADEYLVYYQSQGYGFSEALNLAGDAVYREFNIPKRGTATEGQTSTTSRSQELASRKAGLSVPPGRTGSAMRVEQDIESSEPSRTQTISEIAASRNPQMRNRMR